MKNKLYYFLFQSCKNADDLIENVQSVVSLLIKEESGTNLHNIMQQSIMTRLNMHAYRFLREVPGI